MRIFPVTVVSVAAALTSLGSLAGCGTSAAVAPSSSRTNASSSPSPSSSPRPTAAPPRATASTKAPASSAPAAPPELGVIPAVAIYPGESWTAYLPAQPYTAFENLITAFGPTLAPATEALEAHVGWEPWALPVATMGMPLSDAPLGPTAFNKPFTAAQWKEISVGLAEDQIVWFGIIRIKSSPAHPTNTLYYETPAQITAESLLYTPEVSPSQMISSGGTAGTVPVGWFWNVGGISFAPPQWAHTPITAAACTVVVKFLNGSMVASPYLF